MQIIGPKMEIKKEDLSLPCFYLLGPTKGTEPWQPKMCEELKERVKGNFLVYYPTSQSTSTIPSQYLYKGDTSDLPQVKLDIKLQIHAGLISPQGCIIAWLQAENPKATAEERLNYGRTTARYLGQWFARIQKDMSAGFAWGGDNNYPDLKDMCDEISELLGDSRDIPFYTHMGNLARHAEEIAFSRAATVIVKNYHRLPSH